MRSGIACYHAWPDLWLFDSKSILTGDNAFGGAVNLSSARILTILSLIVLAVARPASAQTVLVEAESFAEPGGWSLDTQFIHVMGSPYMLAHGLGEPVKDATTSVKFPAAGTYKVFVRTKDWVARWNAPGTPGKFQVLIDGKPLATTFGTEGAEWHWQDGGTVEVANTEAAVALHDLTGFEGRCDAIVFSKDPNFVPPADKKELAAWRKKDAWPARKANRSRPV